MDTGTDVLLAVIAAAFTIASPLVIAWRKDPSWPTLLKVGLPIAASLAIAVAYLYFTGGLAGVNLLAAFLIAYGLQQLVYSTILKHIATLLEENTGPSAFQPSAIDYEDTWIDDDGVQHETSEAADLIPGTTLPVDRVAGADHRAE
ncbi:hypothetical protein GCM10023081_46600 [Arthrobacter ginkgonis]|uniref:Uncharacterized protein n=1 Tax=Arthrobacter ginkgonis TaxID=1630594 RepID=A0ABP7DI86_9MICC